MRAIQIVDFAAAERGLARGIQDANRQGRVMLLSDEEFAAIDPALIGTDVTDLGPVVSNPVAGDFEATGDVTVGGQINLGAASGEGITRGGDWGWKDLIGDISPKGLGANAPTRAAFRDAVYALTFGVNDLADLTFHMPHDWAVGTDLFIHVHWAIGGAVAPTDISGSLVIEFAMTFGRGFNQSLNGTFIAPVTATLTVPNLSIANTPAYRHRTDEIQITSSTPTANQLDTDTLEVDGLLLIGMKVTTIPTITDGESEPFVFTVDIHYQSIDAGTTVNKAPNFYGTE